MIFSVVRHDLAQRWKPGLAMGLGLGAFIWVTLQVSSAFLVDLGSAPPLFTNPPRAMSAFLGGEANLLAPSGWLASAIIHPIVLTLSTVAALMIPAASGVSELERGTMDLILSRPVGRVRYLRSRIVSTAALTMIVHSLALCGLLIARYTVNGATQIPLADMLVVWAGNLLLFSFFAMAALWIFVAAPSRSRAQALAITMVVGAFLFNFLSLAFDQMEFLGPITPFRYFRAPTILGGGGFLRDYLILALGIGASAYGALRTFSRRDLSA